MRAGGQPSVTAALALRRERPPGGGSRARWRAGLRSGLGRLGRLAVTLVAVTFFTTCLIDLVPGDPVVAIAPNSSPEQRAELRQRLQLDDPLPARYVDWLGGFVGGDLGSYYGTSSSRAVADDVGPALPVTLQLVLYAQVLALAIAVPLAVVAAQRRGSLLDRLAGVGTLGALAVPNFAVGLIASYVVGVELGWLPPSGYVRVTEDPVEHARRMVLPAVTLGLSQVAGYFRLLRSDMIATLKEDFVLFAKAQGASPSRIVWREALRPSSLALVAVLGVNVGVLIGGAVVMEVIFSLPGIGTLMFQAIHQRQYVALQSLVAIVALLFVVINHTVDVVHRRLDPRIGHAAAH